MSSELSAIPLESLKTARDALRHWLVAHALPLWGTAGVDRVGGGFFEKLTRDGRPVEEPRRARVVTRQIYVFATAARHGWWDGADAVVEHGLRFLLDVQQRGDGLFSAAVRPDGSVVRGAFDLYEHAFVLFALAEAGRGREERLARLSPVADAVRDALRRGFQHPIGGFHESDPPTAPLRTNPHMHLFEAALAWEAVSPPASAAPWRALADEIAGLALTRFVDEDSGALSECFDLDWQAPAAGERIVEPGHQFEWAWLLQRWGHARGHDAALRVARRLLEIGEAHGVARERAAAINELDGTLAPRDRHARLWPQTERLKAGCAAWDDASGDAARAAAAVVAVDAARGLMRFFLAPPAAPVAGLWNERQREDGSFEHDDVRASSLYHIVCAIDTLHATVQGGAASRDNP